MIPPYGWARSKKALAARNVATATDYYCILEFIADSGRFYRFDGKGDLSAAEIEAYDQGREFENGYDTAGER